MIPTMHPAGKSMTNLVDYNERKVSKGVARRLGGQFVGDSMSHIENKTGYFEDRRRIYNALTRPEIGYEGRSAKITKHVSISLVPGEVVDDATFNKIAEMYMQKVGFGKQPYQVYLHQDTENCHIHIISSRISSDHRLISDSNDYRRSQRAAREIEKFFGLEEVSSRKTGQTFIKNGDGEGSVKCLISAALKAAIHEKRASSFSELQSILRESGIAATLNSQAIQKDSSKGEGIAFFLTDAEEKQKSKAIAGENVDPAFKYESLEALLAANRIGKALVIDKGIQERARLALESFTASGQKGPETFRLALEGQGLRPVYKLLNDRPYDLVIYDKHTRESVKLAEIGERFEWKILRKALGYERHPSQDLLDQKAAAEASAKVVVKNPLDGLPEKDNKTLEKETSLKSIVGKAMFEFSKQGERNVTVFAEILMKYGLEPVFKIIAGKPYDVELMNSETKETIRLKDINEKLNWANLSKVLEIKTTIQAKLLTASTQLHYRPFFTEAALNEKLAPLGVKAVLARNSGGVFGISYSDLKTGELHKASEIHEKLSWTNLKGKFFDEANIPQSLADLTARLAKDLKHPTKDTPSATDMQVHLARAGISMVKIKNEYFFEMKEPKVLIPVATILKDKDVETYLGVTEKPLSKEGAYAIKKGLPVVPAFSEKEYKVYSALIECRKEDIIKVASGSNLPKMHPAEELRYAPEIKLFNQAKEVYKGLQRTELFLDGTPKADQHQTGFIGPRPKDAANLYNTTNPPVLGPVDKETFDKSAAATARAIISLLLPVDGRPVLPELHIEAVKGKKVLMDRSEPTFRELIIILNRRKIGVFMNGFGDEETKGLYVSSKEDRGVAIAGKRLSPAMQKAFEEAVARSTHDSGSVSEELEKAGEGPNPGFLEVLTEGQQKYYDACFNGNALIISLERQKGNSVKLTPQEINIINSLFPGAYEEGQTNNYASGRHSTFNPPDYEPSFNQLLQKALAGTVRNDGYRKPEEMGPSPAPKTKRRKPYR